MATPKTKAAPKANPTPKANPAIKNTSAPPAPGNSAEVSVQGAAPSAPLSGTEAAGQSSSEALGIPPAGGVKNSEPVAKALIVSAKAEGFRRAGRRWTAEAQTVSVDEFSQEQIEALLGEPMLDVVVVAE